MPGGGLGELAHPAGVGGEGLAEGGERGIRVGARERLETDHTGEPGIAKCLGHARVADLPGARLAPARDVGHLHLGDPGQGCAAELDEVPLADLRVVEVEVEPQVRRVDAAHEVEGVGGLRERGARVVDSGVEVLEHEGDALALAELGDAAQAATGGVPHRRRHLVGGHDRKPAVVEPGAVQVQARGAQPSRHHDRLGGGAQQLVSAVLVGEGAGGVTRHRREDDAALGQGLQLVEVVVAPVPDLDGEPGVKDRPHPVGHGTVDEQHLGTGGEGEG